ncbi:hypothetical protein [Algoriphagus terrigena]|uniref:hypothetical protein n=1 Tax=Algoriphagus terrigena TaxID=344884 RepID=UPI0003FA0291|nr:hypothetical protein [Algoriphagus terrigena]
MKKVFTCCLVFLVVTSEVSIAQDSQKESFWGIAVGIRSQNFQDQLVTQTKYSGGLLYFMINHEKNKANTWRKFNFEAGIGSMKSEAFEAGQVPARYLQPSVKSYWNEISYSHLFQIKSEEKSSFYVGPGVSNVISVRYSPRWDNSQINYEFTGNLQAEGRYLRAFELWGKDMKASFTLKLPIVGYIARPGYSGVPEFLDHEKDFGSSLFDNTSVSWLGNFPRIQFDNYVEFPIAGGNKMQVIYNWEYYSFQSPVTMHSAAHTIGVNFLMKAK